MNEILIVYDCIMIGWILCALIYLVISHIYYYGLPKRDKRTQKEKEQEYEFWKMIHVDCYMTAEKVNQIYLENIIIHEDNIHDGDNHV